MLLAQASGLPLLVSEGYRPMAETAVLTRIPLLPHHQDSCRICRKKKIRSFSLKLKTSTCVARLAAPSPLRLNGPFPRLH